MNLAQSFGLLAVVGLCVASIVSVPSSVMAVEKPKASESELQQMYIAHLESEGYAPTIDGDGDIVFKIEGKTYCIIIDEDDPQFFQLVFPGFWRVESDEERAEVLVAAHQSTLQTKCTKVYIVRDNVWAAIEIFVESPKDFEGVFNRSLSALQAGVRNFTNEMQ